MSSSSKKYILKDPKTKSNKNLNVSNHAKSLPNERSKYELETMRSASCSNIQKKTCFALEAKWEKMFKRLEQYREKNGDCLVPNRYTNDPQLGTWVATQRRQFRSLLSGSSISTPMTPERAARLNRIGFEWSPKDPRSVPWETRYRELVEFVSKNGHAQVPMKMKENTQLSNWVSTQRQEYKLLQKGLASRMTPDRIKLLDAVGFVWQAKRGSQGMKRNEINTSSVMKRNESQTFSVAPNIQNGQFSLLLPGPESTPHAFQRTQSASASLAPIASDEHSTSIFRGLALAAAEQELHMIKKLLSKTSANKGSLHHAFNPNCNSSIFREPVIDSRSQFIYTAQNIGLQGPNIQQSMNQEYKLNEMLPTTTHPSVFLRASLPASNTSFLLRASNRILQRQNNPRQSTFIPSDAKRGAWAI